jgi:hypothetical protein
LLSPTTADRDLGLRRTSSPYIGAHAWGGSAGRMEAEALRILGTICSALTDKKLVQFNIRSGSRVLPQSPPTWCADASLA